jgi:hypothetical protein
MVSEEGMLVHYFIFFFISVRQLIMYNFEEVRPF